VLGVEAVAKGVADHLVGHHPGMPRLGQAKQTLVTTDSLVHALHGAIITGERDAPAVGGRSARARLDGG
jgi:hypothetical protein